MSARRHITHTASAGFWADLVEALRDYGKRTSPGHKRAVVFLILVGTVLRALLLARPIAYEEAFVYMQFATQPFGMLIADRAHPDNHILHTLLTKWSTGLFGVGLMQLRLPAFIAGVLIMPLFYFFVRAMFNRYIALLTLAVMAASGPLIDYSVLARGYSITWLCCVLAFVLGRHLIKTNSVASAVLVGVVCALGMWSVPSMIFCAIMIFVWLLVSLTSRYDDSLRPRINLLLLSIVVFVVLTALLYAPVIRANGIDQLIHHPSVPYLNKWQFRREYGTMFFELWAYLEDSTSGAIVILGLLGLLQAAFVSSKYRTMCFGLVIGTVPLVSVLRQIIPTQDWLFALLVFHLSTGIAVFYLLKFLQEKMFKGWGKRTRTQVAALVLLVVFAVPGMYMALERTTGMPEAAAAVSLAKSSLQPGDKLYVVHPWDSPVQFHAISKHLDPMFLSGVPAPGAKILVGAPVDPEVEPAAVLRHYQQDPEQWTSMHMVQDWPGLRIFAAP